MEFNIYRGGFENTNMHQNHQQVFRTSSYVAPSSSSYTYFSDQARFLSQRSEIEREMEKERIRHEIIADELRRQCVLEAEVRRELIMECDMTVRPLLLEPQPLRSYHQFHPEMMHVESFVPENRRIEMPLPKTYYGSGSGGGHHAEKGGFEVVPFQRRPPSPSPKIKEIAVYQPKDAKKEFVALEPFGSTVSSGSKRKLPTPPLSAAASSSGVPLDISKKKKEEWRCAICEVSATSENGLNDHIGGEKHLAKVAALQSGNNGGGEIGLGKIKTPVKEQPLEIKTLSECVPVSSKNEGESKPKNSRIWCNLCKAGAPDEKAFSSHKKGEKHLKNLLSKERAKNKARRQ